VTVNPVSAQQRTEEEEEEVDFI